MKNINGRNEGSFVGKEESSHLGPTIPRSVVQ